MKNLSTRLICLLIAIGVSASAFAQGQQPMMAGAAAKQPNGSGGAGQQPQNDQAQAGAYQNPNAPKPLPPLTAPPGGVNTANYPAAVDMVSPLTDKEIIKLRKRLDDGKRAAATSPTTPSRPEIGRTLVDLSPGAPPPLFTPGIEGGVMAFTDIAGEPWEIVKWVNMATERFDVLQPIDSIPSLTITPKGDYVSGNVAVFLKGLNTAVVVRMVAAQRNADVRRDMQLPRRGPSSASVGQTKGVPGIGLPADYMQTILDGVETPGAKPIEIKNAPAGTKAWKIGEKIVLRTNFPLNNPASTGEIGAADGTRVYEFAPTPIVTISDNGTLRNLYLELE